MTSLPDVNVLLALVAGGHKHHLPAKAWFIAQGADSVAICRVTQMGLLRLLTNPKVLPAGAFTIRQAWDISHELLADKRVFFEYEPPELESTWANMMNRPNIGPSSWTDAYLAAFARKSDYELVTFDQGFRRWSDATRTLLLHA